MESAFYERSGQDTYVATAATVGPWSPDAQHGGPPSALAAKAIEEHLPDARHRLARVAIDILRPVPVGKVTIRTRMVRTGRRVTLVEALMEADAQEVMHGRGWRIERSAESVPEVPDGGPPLPVPDSSAGLPPQLFTGDQEGYLAAIEWRFLADGLNQAGAPGRAAWTRPRIPLLAGEDSSPMSRALLVADSGSGVSAVLPSSEYLFVNVDLSVILTRDPAGEWLLLESSTTVGPDGTGLAATRLSDHAGGFGRGLQTLLVAPRLAPLCKPPRERRLTRRHQRRTIIYASRLAQPRKRPGSRAGAGPGWTERPALAGDPGHPPRRLRTGKRSFPCS